MMRLCEVVESKRSDRTLYSWWEDGKKGVEVKRSLTYSEVGGLAVAAATLLKSAASPGDRVLLVFEPGLTFITAFFGCATADVIAVPVFPPQPGKKKLDSHAFANIQKGCGAETALTSSGYNMARKTLSLPKLKWLVFDPKPAEGPLVPAEFQEVSFLQYTSGSTSEPKGVVITHECLWDNLQLILQEVKADETTVVVSWLPQYHDMGLIGSYLGTATCGGRGYYTSPVNFVKRPSTWVEAISAFRGTHMQAPNFAFGLAVRKFEDRELDLSSARHIINGAEPIEAAVIDAFYDKFKPYGLKEVIFPTYGLAEHTVLVSTNGRERISLDPKALEEKKLVESPEGRCFVGCGVPPVEIKIEGDIGEILVKSKSVAKGYWNGDDFGEYLQTGDEGFMRNGELFICGRLKDLIILRGKNHYPQDVEHTVERNEHIRAGCVAAFGQNDQLVVVAEVRDTASLKDLARSLAEDVNLEHGLKARFVLLKPRTIPKTTSGKIARRRCKAALVAGDLDKSTLFDGDAVADAQEDSSHLLAVQRGGLEADLAKDLADIASLNVNKLRVDRTLTDLGLDSLGLAQFRGVLESKYKLTNLPDDLLFRDDCTLATLASLVGESFDEAKYTRAVAVFEIDREQTQDTKKKNDWLVENCPCLLVCCPRSKKRTPSER